MTRTCDACGQANRIPADKLTEDARCGRCKGSLGPANAPIDVSTEEFDAITQASEVPILVDFWAAWCGPCRMAAPAVKKVAEKFSGRALVLKVNTDDNPELASRFGVRGIPNFLVMKGGQAVHQQPGLVSDGTLSSWIERAL
jgi:thioredoxin 2